jgi:hypothetical protein
MQQAYTVGWNNSPNYQHIPPLEETPPVLVRKVPSSFNISISTIVAVRIPNFLNSFNKLFVYFAH